MIEILDDHLTEVADAIRRKTQKSDLIPAENFASEILSIPQTVTSTLQASKSIDIITNGTTKVSPDTGYDGIKELTVNTNVSSYTYTIIGISSSGTGSATVSDNFTIPKGKTKACILGIVNTQGVSDWSCTVSLGSATITETEHYDATNSYNNSQNVNHMVKTYDIITDGNECVINIVCGKSSNANRFAFAMGIY